MKLFITVKPNAKQDKVESLDATHYRVWVKASPQEGEANTALIRVLAEYFGKPKSSVVLLSGRKSRNKVIGLS